MYKLLYKWHKWAGLVVCVPIMLWALSGLLHPTLRLTKPVLATEKYSQLPLTTESMMLGPEMVLSKHAITDIKNIRVVSIQAQHYYRVNLVDGSIAYFDTQSGERLVDGERRYAEYMARHYLGDQNTVTARIEPVNEFNDEYLPINRFLPVWRVDFARNDGLRLYVDTESSRLASSVDNLQAELLWWFGVLHNWNFLEQGNWLRIGIFLIAMLAMFTIGVTGMVLYGLRYQCMKKAANDKSRSGVAYFHRSIGLLISLSTLMFSFSGGVHVWHKLTPDDRHTHCIEDLFSVNELATGIEQAILTSRQQGGVGAVSMVRLANEPYYRLVHGADKHADMNHSGHGKAGNDSNKWPAITYVHSQDGTVLAGAESLYAQQLAHRISGMDKNQISTVQPVTRFNQEYGFIDRRLPVVRVDYNTAGNPVYYVDPATGRLAAMVDDGHRFEKFVFQMFHKWRFADNLGKNGRDAVIAVFILLNVMVTILGVSLYVSKRRRTTYR